MHSNDRQELKEVCAGDIAAAVGLKDVTTGDTLCAQDHVITLERMVFPEPVIAMAVEPKTKSDQEKMGVALGRLAAEDPSFRVRTDEESGQTIIAGMGELHLDILVDRMRREFDVEANVGRPQVAYRETIRHEVRQEGRFVRQAGGKGQYGHVVLEIDPAASEARVTCSRMRIAGGVVPKEYVPAVDKGIQEVMASGPLAGYPGGGCQGATGRRFASRSGFSAKWRSGSPASTAFQEGFQQGGAGPARADHEGRGGHARGVHG